jgi:aspartyl-tRNA(Asn)/glutamyl-tRNA(Gln) amidotransferase subunit A
MPTVTSDDRASEPQLLRIAVAVLGEERAAHLREALLERVNQLQTVAAGIGESHDDGTTGRRGGAATRASLEAFEECLDRVDEVERSLGAFAWIDREIGDASPAPSSCSLDGFAIAVKDIIDVRGMPTRCGSPLTSPESAERDASVVGRLRRAGAAVVGKTRCTEWALNDPAPTCNPWDLTRTPGGSSSGSAVAVATGMCTATIDTQTAGDVLRPAAYNGVVGFKPTLGWAPADGIQPVAPSIDTVGVIARTVVDAGAVVGAIAGERDRYVAPEPTLPRVGLLDDGLFARADASVRNNVVDVAEQLASRGAPLARLPSPVELRTVHAAHRVITFAECAAQHRARLSGSASGFGPRARELIELGLVTPAYAYVEADRVRREVTKQLSRLFESVDVLVMPVTPAPAPARETTGDSRFQIPWTLCGFPALGLPSGSADGLPLGVQVVAARGHDVQLVAYARWCEEVLDVHLTPAA